MFLIGFSNIFEDMKKIDEIILVRTNEIFFSERTKYKKADW